MAIHSTILAWKIPWTKDLGGLQFIGWKESDTTEHTHTHTSVVCMSYQTLQYVIHLELTPPN